MISIKDYAKENGVSYEAVRQQVKRYQSELEGHIHQEGRTQYLDDVAVAILDSHRARNPVVLYDKGRDEKIQDLEKKVSDLNSQLDLYKTKLIQTQDRLLLSEGAQLKLEAAEKETKFLSGFIRDAKEEIRVLTEEKATEIAARKAAEEKAAEDLRRIQEEARKEIEAAQEAAEAHLKAEMAKMEERVVQAAQEAAASEKKALEDRFERMNPLKRLFWKRNKET